MGINGFPDQVFGYRVGSISSLQCSSLKSENCIHICIPKREIAARQASMQPIHPRRARNAERIICFSNQSFRQKHNGLSKEVDASKAHDRVESLVLIVHQKPSNPIEIHLSFVEIRGERIEEFTGSGSTGSGHGIGEAVIVEGQHRWWPWHQRGEREEDRGKRDGPLLSAWAILKEKPHSVDLILTEVELPSVTGFGLLTMIMEHENCRRIPVIMMSSQDSMSLVFNCMLRGAADFLVKPIRKNELRNLWQHSSGIKHVHQDGNLSEQRLDAISGNNAASNRSSEYMACVQKDREYSEKGSDTALMSSRNSSCTKPDLEVESAGVHNTHAFLQPKSKIFSTMIGTEVQDCENHIKLGGLSLTGDNTTEEKYSFTKALTRDEESAQACNKHDACVFNGADADINKLVKPSIEAIDLIGAIDNQQNCSLQYFVHAAVHDNMPMDTGYFPDKKDDKNGHSMPLLELSLKSQQTSYEDRETEERHTLHHSDSSAFSWYNNRTVQPQPSTNFGAEVQHRSHKPVPIHNHELADRAYRGNVVSPNKNQEGSNSPIVGAPVQEKMVFPCSPIGVIPDPIPVRSRVHHALHSSYEALISRLNQSQSGPPKPRENTTSQQDTSHFLSHQSSTETLNFDLNYHHRHDQNANAGGHRCQPVPSQKKNSESTHDPICISSAVAEGSSTSLCNGSSSHLTGSAGRNAGEGSKGNATATSHGGATPESVNGAEVLTHDKTKVGDYWRHSSDREAALTKFRLKRKDRCFEKKVRYQSRKRLAELRPRVKGQFVRQIHSEPHPRPMKTDWCGFDSLAA
ncbi:hypothetical protein ACLOJK_032050 [Asimina triloba]